MFDAVESLTKVGAAAASVASGSDLSTLTEADKQSILTNMLLGGGGGLIAGYGGGWFLRNRFIKDPTKLMLTGAVTWLGNRFLFGSALEAKAQAGAEGLKSITPGDMFLATAPGAFGLVWIGVGAYRLIKGR